MLQPDLATSRRTGADDGAAPDSDDDATDLTSDVLSDPTGPVSDSPKRTTAAIKTAKCSIDYNVDWDGAEGSAGPCLPYCGGAAKRCAPIGRHLAVVDHAVATEHSQPCRRAGALSQGKTYKLMRALRKRALNYLGQLWMLTSDLRHAKDAAV